MDDKRATLGPLLERAGVGVLVVWFLLRLFVVATPGSDPGGTLFIGLLAWVGGGAYVAGCALSGGWVLRRSGLELVLFALAVLCAVSPHRATYKLTAIEGALAFVTAFFAFLLIVDQCGRGYRRLWFAAFVGGAAVAVLYGLVQAVYLFPQLRDMTYEEAVGHVGEANAEEFLERVRAGEPHGIFLLSNTLAGFLAMVLPVLAGRILDARRKFGPGEAVLAAVLVAGVFLIYKTGSRGGVVAAAAAAVAFGVLWFARARKTGPGMVFGWGVAAVVLAVVVLWPLGGWAKLTERVDSMRYRAGYWGAATRLWGSDPWLGVGLYQYGEAYPRVRSTIEETTQVHNDYLQVLTELGVAGLAVFLAFLYFLLWGGLKAAQDHEKEARDPPLGGAGLFSLGMAAFAAFALAYFMAGSFNDLGGSPALALAFFAGFLGVAACAGSMEGIYARLGWTAGLAGYLVHATVDFDLFTFGFAAAFFAFAAIGASTRRLSDLDVGRAPALVLAAGMLLLSLLLLGGFAPRWIRAEARFGEARRLREAAFASPERLVGVDLLDRAREAVEDARDANPLDARAYSFECELLWDLWEAKTAPPDLAAQELADTEDLLIGAVATAQRGSEARPDDAEMNWRMGYSYILLSRLHERLSLLPEHGNAAQARTGDLMAAAEMFADAQRKNPISPRYHYWQARTYVLQMARDPGAGGALRRRAEEEYARARRWAAQGRYRRQREYWRPDEADELEGLLSGESP